MKSFKTFQFVCIVLVIFSSCKNFTVNQETRFFPEHVWPSEKPAFFSFEISDTTHPYCFYVVFRHEYTYRYLNIWLESDVYMPDSSFRVVKQYDLADQNGWKGLHMDDIWESSLPLCNHPIFLKKGKYFFKIRHLMKEDPLFFVSALGLRVEKTQ